MCIGDQNVYFTLNLCVNVIVLMNKHFVRAIFFFNLLMHFVSSPVVCVCVCAGLTAQTDSSTR